MWQQYITNEGKKYYFNKSKDETTWDEPAEGFIPAEEESKNEVGDAAGDVAQGGSLEANEAVVEAQEEEPEQDDEEVEFEHQVLGKVLPNQSQHDSQRRDFKKMLFDLQLPDNLTWTEAYDEHKKKFTADARFTSVPAHRRAILFGEFMIARKAALIRREEIEKKRNRKLFIQSLTRLQPEVCVGMSFEEAQAVCQSFEWWNCVNQADRQELYEEWEWELQKEFWKTEQEMISSSSEILKDELRSVVRSEAFTLSEFNSLFEKSEAYIRLPRKYRIDIFCAHIRHLETSASKESLEERKHKRWNSLIVREGLTLMLEKAQKAGEITYASSWVEIRDKFLYTESGEPNDMLLRFLDSQYTGTQPQDLVESFVESKLRSDYKEWRRLVPKEADPFLSEEEFRAQMRMSEAWPLLESKQAYISLLQEERRADAELDTKMDTFRQLLEEKISRRSSRHWSSVKKRLIDDEAFQALHEDDARNVFDTWMREQDEADKTRRQKRDREGQNEETDKSRDQKKSHRGDEKEEGEI